MLGVLDRLVNDPELWRGRAEEARATGEQTTGIEAREILFRIAEHYDWLAPMRGKGTAQETRRPLGAQFLTRADGRVIAALHVFHS